MSLWQKVLFDFRSQLLDGYNYSGTTPILSSSFLSPAHIRLAVKKYYRHRFYDAVKYGEIKSR